jgi:hypothetical protein
MNKIVGKKLRSHEDVLEAIAEAIDIPEHMDQIARERYKSIGNWLDRDASTLKAYKPEVSPQGSFLLGTVIRPVGDYDDYDLDLVCRLNGTKTDFTMASLKEAVGGEIQAYAKANNMDKKPHDSRRCWRLEYANEARFHIDILPALPDEEAYRMLLERSGHKELAANANIRARAIAITDKTHPRYDQLCADWPVSNPKGYGVWFMSRQTEIAKARKQRLFERERIYASVDDVPDYKLKTPLQRAVQLLRRHRDVMFNGDDHKPISIIITTLSAHAYNGEASIADALRTILKNMHLHIEVRNGVAWVANPVNPEENFADKWAETPIKATNFHRWLERARRDFGLYLSASPYDQFPDQLQEALSSTTVERVLPLIVSTAPAIITSSKAAEAEAHKIREQGGATKPWCR